MTGGFFRCTRYEVVEKVDEQHKTDISEATNAHKSLQELNRFVHYYTRYENHKHSLEVGVVLSFTAATILIAHAFYYKILIIFISAGEAIARED